MLAYDIAVQIPFTGVFVLAVNPGQPEERQFVLQEGIVAIGRTRDNPVFCPHKSLSRKHAELDFDGAKVKLRDLQSKNGTHLKGGRVTECELRDGDTFRCGDISFQLRELAVLTPGAVQDPVVGALPSLWREANPSVDTARPAARSDDDTASESALNILIRASEVCASDRTLREVVEQLIDLAWKAVSADRLVFLTIDEGSGEATPRLMRSRVSDEARLYSERVVQKVIDEATPALFADVSSARSLPERPGEDLDIRAAIAVPINPGDRMMGALYADSLSSTGCFRPSDVATIRAIANLVGLALVNGALRAATADGS